MENGSKTNMATKKLFQTTRILRKQKLFHVKIEISSGENDVRTRRAPVGKTIWTLEGSGRL